MATTRTRRTRKPKDSFLPWETAYLTGDESYVAGNKWWQFALENLKAGSPGRGHDRTPAELRADYEKS